MTYVFITFFVLLFLNLYCSDTSQTVLFESKKSSMIEKCLLASDEIAALEVLNTNTIGECLTQMESLTATRLVVTDQAGRVLYDSSGTAVGSFFLLPEVIRAVEVNNVCSFDYHGGIIETRAATPVVYYGTVIGCVYMMEYDTSQGALIQSLQNTVLRISLILEAVLLLFTIFFSTSFSRRLRKIMASMRIIQEGDYTHKLDMGGSDELTLLGNEFNDLTARLQTSEQKRHRFVSDASHELKTPLASIKLLSDTILQNDMDMQTVREFVGDIGDEADRLTRMTGKLLSLTKVDGQEVTECEIVYMAPTVQRVVRMLSGIAAQNNITFRLELDNDCPILIQEDDLYQIIFNLIENGIKYNTPGGTVAITLDHQEDNAYLQVSDTGMGIPEDAIGHIFERFYRVDKARSRQTGGSGLGLAIVRAIVQRNRGGIEVSSTPGQGTTFTVSFPAFDTEVDKA